MKIIVLVKTITSIGVRPTAPLKGFNVGTAGTRPTTAAINPLDEFALEEALRIKEEAPGSDLTAVSLGGADAEIGLRRGLAMGADKALHLVSEDAEAWDSWASAFALALLLRRVMFRLVLCGGESLDRNAGLVGPFVAEIPGVPHVSRIAGIQELDDRVIVVQRRTERGGREVIECTLPALITVAKSINRPRLPSFKAIARARVQAIDRITLTDLEEPDTSLGRSMNLTEVVSLSRPKPRRGGASRVDATHAAADRRLLMMKGGNQKVSGNCRILEGVSDTVVDELERLLRDHGIEFGAKHTGTERKADSRQASVP